MQIVSLLPIGKVVPQRELSYWSSKDQREGNIVKATARGKEIFGVVMRASPLADMKQEVKEAGFSYQKVSGEGRRVLSRPFLRAAFDIADWHATAAGSVIAALTPQTVLENASKLPDVPFDIEPKKAVAPKIEQLVGSRAARLEAYKRLPRDKSTLIAAPTVIEAERLAAELGAELLHAELPKKKLLETWTRIARSEQPLLVVGTPLVLSAPCTDVGTIVLERSHARRFAREERPYLDIRAAASMLAAAHGAKLVLGSSTPPIEETSATALAAPATAIRLVDMQPPKTDGEKRERKKFQLFSDEAREYIGKALAAQKNVLLLTARKGLATQTVCDDCGQTYSCATCGAGLVLYEVHGKRVFRCAFCGSEEPTLVKCRNCQSWRLRPLGVGLSGVATEIKKLFPDARVLEADEDALRTQKKAAALVREFEDSHGAVLAGTEGVLPYLTRLVPLSVIVSIDSFLYMPEYSATERALALLADVRDASERLLVQTRAIAHPAIKAIAEGSFEGFVTNERALREKFSYPPFATLVRASVEGTGPRATLEAEKLKKALAAWKPQVFPGRALKRNYLRFHLLMRLPRDAWPDRRLVTLLRSLPPNIEVRVNPRSVLSD